MTPDQPVLPLCQEGENTNFVVFFIRPGITPMIYYTPDEKANHIVPRMQLKILTHKFTTNQKKRQESNVVLWWSYRVYLMVMLVQINNPISMLYCQRHHFDIFFVYLYRKWLYIIYVEKVATAVINVTTVINQVMWHLIVLVPEDHGI